MNKKVVKAKRKKRKATPEELSVLKEQQKLLYLRQRRKAKKRQLQLLRIKSLIKLGSVIFILLFAIYALLIPQWKISPFTFENYPNNNLVIKDNIITKDEMLIKTLQQFKIPDKPIYMIDTDVYKKELLKLDTIEDVFIRRYWLPARLIITVKEKQPLFLIYKNINTTPIYALNTDGSYLGKQYFPLPEKYSKDVYKIVVSAKSELLNNNNINKYETLINIAEKTTGESLIYFDIRNPSDVYLIMSKCLIRLGEVDATVIERISRLKAIMPSVKPLENNLEYIDLRWDKALSLKEKIEEKNKIKEPNKKIEPVESIDTIKAVEQREANEALEKKEKLKQLENIQTTDKKDPIQQTSNESDP